MEEIEIGKVIVKENIRSDYGDITELTASMKEHGVRKPIELNKNNELIDGYRRFKAAKAAGLTKIPFFYSDGKIDKTTSQMIAGIFQKNLNPVEEGKAFRKYMDENKITTETLAKKISKQTTYIKKRLLLVNLPADVQGALIEKRIQLGHALLLAKLTKQDSSRFLREIITNRRSVADAKESMGYQSFSKRLVDAPFDRSQCKGCKYNGSEQTELFETGKILNGTCMNQGCFVRKVKEFVKKKKEELKNVLLKDNQEVPRNYINPYSWDAEGKGLTTAYKAKCRRSRENYFVKISEIGRIEEYFKQPGSEEIGKKSQKKIETVRKEKLGNRVNEYKRNFLIDKSIELMQPGTKEAKALTLIQLVMSAGYSDIGNVSTELNKVIRVGNTTYGDRKVNKIYEASEKDLDKAISIVSKMALSRLDMKELITTSRSFKVDVKKHFVITREFLELYTKDQLVDLIEEFKLYVDAKDPKVKTISFEKLKKSEIIQHILNQNLKGKIPKILI